MSVVPRRLTNLFMVNDKPFIAPDIDPAFSYEDIDSSDTGRTEDGVMHREVVRYKVGKWAFTYSQINEADRNYMESIFPDEPEFDFTHPSRKDSSVMVTTRCYRSKYNLAWRSVKTGKWNNYTFDIIEC